MKTLGIVGGIGPESTVAYYRQIVQSYREQTGDGSYPPVIINSIDLTRMLSHVSTGNLPGVTEYLLNAVFRLAHAGADVGLLAANTPHIVFDELQRRSPIPLMSIVTAARQAVETLGVTTVGLFGIRPTMQGDFYPKEFAKRGIRLVTPGAGEQDYIHERYLNELVNGLFLPETHAGLLKIVDRLMTEENIQALLLGGTELPLILKETSYRGIPFIDTTKCHVRSALAGMLSDAPMQRPRRGQ